MAIKTDLKIGQLVNLDWDGPCVAMVVGLELNQGEVVVRVARGKDEEIYVREGEISIVAAAAAKKPVGI